MSGNSKAMPFLGILAMGNTKDEAVNRYRLLALGKGVSAMRSESGNFAFVTHASNKIAELFNPQNGELDLTKDDSILSKLQFEAKAGEVEANHYVCESGCGLHMVYDSDELVKNCPACTTAIAGDDDEESDEDESAEESDDDEEDVDADDEGDDEDFDSESADDEEESEDEESEDDEGDDADEESEDDESDEEESEDDESEDDEGDDADDDEEADEEEEDDSGEPLVIAADSKEKAIEIYREHRHGIATAATTVEVEYVVCSSNECNAHIISEDPTLTQCPACNSDTKQPETVQSSDEDESEDDEDSDLEVIPDDDEESEEEEDTSESNTQVAEQNQQPKEVMNVENVTVNMLSQLNDAAEDAHKGLDVSFSHNVAGTPLWTAFYNGTPVATASKADAGKNADIFEQPAFGHVVIAGAKHVGVKSTLDEMGFKGIAHEISLNSVVIDKVNAQVAEAKAGLDRDRQEHAERLMAALATAAIGINRGFFQDTANPVKAALWNAMSSAGVKNAEVLIDNAFRTSNDEYHRSLFAKASEIIGQPLEVQESLSKAVLGTNYMNAATASANTPGNAFEDRLELGRSTATASEQEEAQQPNQESVSSDANERISRTIAGLGRRRS